MIGESKVQYCREKQLIPVRHIYGLQFFNNCFAVFYNTSPVVSVSRRNVFYNYLPGQNISFSFHKRIQKPYPYRNLIIPRIGCYLTLTQC